MQESLNEKVQLLFSGSQLRGSSRSAERAHGPAELTAGAKTDPADSAEMPELKSKLAGHVKENRLAYLLSELAEQKTYKENSKEYHEKKATTSSGPYNT